MTGADIRNIVNQATLYAVKAGRESCTMEDFDAALDRVKLGLARSSMYMSR